MQLDRKKPFGKITGETFVPPGADRPAMYEQEGKFFDNHMMLIGTGGTQAEIPADDADDGQTVEDDDLPTMTVAELISQANTMSWPAFKKKAQQTLGPSCPPTKIAIVEALKGAQQEFDTRAQKRAKDRGVTPPPVSSSSVDLGAWARGQREYLWGDIKKAIKAEFGRNVSERDDAVEFLIAQHVIAAGEARRDVIRGA